MVKPTFVCVPGAWSSPEYYSQVREIIAGYGYPTIGLPLPSVGATPAHMNFDGDVKAIRDCLTKLVEEEEKEVVLVLHSYGGMPGTEAPVDLGKKEREGKGLKGGVLRLVFIMALVGAEGFEPGAGGAEFPDWMKLDLENGIVTVTPEDAKKIFYHDIPSEEGDKWASKLTHQSLGSYTGSKISYAAWRYIPSTYVIGTADRTIISKELAEAMVNSARELQPSAFDVVETCDSGHSIMLSRPEWLADVLRRAAGEKA